MPYGGKDGKELPANVKKLPKKKQEQWVSVWNSSYAKHGDESKAFAMANGVVGKKKGLIDDWWEVDHRQIEQDEAGYSPTGGSGDKMCASCQWFVPSDDACVVVRGDIVATGLSDFWHEKVEYVPDPMPVVIVSDETKEASSKPVQVANVNGSGSALVNKMVSFLQSIVPQRAAPPSPLVQAESALLFYKSGDGKLRWFARYSNCYKDRDREFISTASHKEYVEWVHRTGVYPELWLWHTPGSRIGKADFVDFDSGIAVASGLIDEKSLSIAEHLSDGVDNLGASHGFFPVVTIGNVVHKHWTFEISVLPSGRASAYGTGYNFYRIKEGDMKPEQREWFKAQGVPEEQIDAWAESTTKMANALKDSGLEYKEVTEDGTNAVGLLVQQQVAVTKALTELTEKVGALAKTEKEKVDEAVAAAITPAVTPTTQGVHVPTLDNSNVVPATKEDKLIVEDKEVANMVEMMFGVKVGA